MLQVCFERQNNLDSCDSLFRMFVRTNLHIGMQLIAVWSDIKLLLPIFPIIFSLNIIPTDTIESNYYSSIIEQSRSGRHNPDSLSFPRSFRLWRPLRVSVLYSRSLATLCVLSASVIRHIFALRFLSDRRVWIKDYVTGRAIEESRFNKSKLEAILISPKNCARHDTGLLHQSGLPIRRQITRTCNTKYAFAAKQIWIQVLLGTALISHF